MTPQEFYQAGKLNEAIEAAFSGVKAHPADSDQRGFLCELLCYAGDLERADKQLDTIGHQDPQSIIGLSMFRQLIRGEVARQEFFEKGRVPEVVREPSEVIRLHLEASISMREDNPAEAAEKLAEAEEKRIHVRGTCDGQAFDDWRDLNDMTACVFEVITSTGKYYWVPVEAVEVIEFRKPERPRDLLWRRAHMVVKDGPDGEVFLPTLYLNTHRNEDDQLRLGRGTDWADQENGPTIGVGQRMYLVGEEAKPILQMERVEFEQPED